MRRLILKSVLAVVSVAVAGSAFSQSVFRITTIPEEAATEQTRKFGPIVKYLERKLGQKVEFIPVSDYPAAVEALVNKQVDMVWFGGFTFAGKCAFGWKNCADCAARRRHQVSVGLHHQA